MAYRANVTDSQQEKIESAANDSGIAIYLQRDGVGQKKIIPAYDLSAVNDAKPTPNDAVALNSRDSLIIGSHNDKAHRFVEPGRA